MPYDGNGNFVRLHNWTADAANGLDINATEMDAEDNGFATGLSNAVTRDGQGKMTVDFLPNADNVLNLGSGVLRWASINGLPINLFTNFPWSTRTAAEVLAGVTVVNFGYPSGVVDRYGTNTTPGITDMTQAIKNAVLVNAAGGPPVTFLGALYLVTSTAISIGVTQPRITVQGVPLGTIILNKAAASNPTIKLAGATYFDISGLVLIGATGFTNDGIQLVKDGSGNRTAFGSIRKIVCQTNGYGLEIQDSNTVDIQDFQYWPSGGNWGGTIDTNGQPGAIYASGSGAVNGITLRNINIGNVNAIGAGGAGIDIDGSGSAAPFQAWEIDELECEVVGCRAIWARHVNIGSFKNLFVENAEVRFDNSCVRCAIMDLEAAASGTVVIDSTQSLGACHQFTFVNCQAKSVVCDAGNAENVYLNCNFSVSPGFNDVSPGTSWVNVETTGSVLLPDMVGAKSTLGFTERGRSTAVGTWITPAFSAGNFSGGGAMTWTVSSGNVTTLKYMLVGKTMTIEFHISGSTTGGTANAILLMTLPGGFVASDTVYIPCRVQNNGVWSFGLVLLNGSVLGFYMDPTAATNWALSANTGMSGCISFEIN